MADRAAMDLIARATTFSRELSPESSQTPRYRAFCFAFTTVAHVFIGMVGGSNY